MKRILLATTLVLILLHGGQISLAQSVPPDTAPIEPISDSTWRQAEIVSLIGGTSPTHLSVTRNGAVFTRDRFRSAIFYPEGPVKTVSDNTKVLNGDFYTWESGIGTKIRGGDRVFRVPITGSLFDFALDKDIVAAAVNEHNVLQISHGNEVLSVTLPTTPTNLVVSPQNVAVIYRSYVSLYDPNGQVHEIPTSCPIALHDTSVAVYSNTVLSVWVASGTAVSTTITTSSCPVLRFSPDGRYLAVSTNKEITVYDSELNITGQCTLPVSLRSAPAVDFFNGKIVAGGEGEYLWECDPAHQTKLIREGIGLISSLSSSGNTIMAGTENGIVVYSIDRRKVDRIYTSKPVLPLSADFSGGLFAQEKTLVKWTQKGIETVETFDSPITALASAVTEMGTVWAVATNKHVYIRGVISSHYVLTVPVTSLAINLTGENPRIVAGGGGGIFSTNLPDMKSQVYKIGGAISQVAISPDNQIVAVSGPSGVVLLTADGITTIPVPGATGVAFSPDNQFLAIVNHSDIILHKMSTGEEKTISLPSVQPKRVIFSDSGWLVVSGGENTGGWIAVVGVRKQVDNQVARLVSLFDRTAPVTEGTPVPHTVPLTPANARRANVVATWGIGRIDNLNVGPDGMAMITSQGIRLYDFNLRLLRFWGVKNAYGTVYIQGFGRVAWSRTPEDPFHVYLWNLNDVFPKMILDIPSTWIEVSPSGKIVWAPREQNMLVVNQYDVELCRVLLPGLVSYKIAVSDDGTTAAAVVRETEGDSDTERVVVVDIQSGCVPKTEITQRGDVDEVRLSPDGKYIVTVNWEEADYLLRVTDISTNPPETEEIKTDVVRIAQVGKNALLTSITPALYTLPDLRLVFRLPEYWRAAAILPDGKIVLGGEDGEVALVTNRHEKIVISSIEQGKWGYSPVFENGRIIASGFARNLTDGQYLGPVSLLPPCRDEYLPAGFAVECTQSGIQVSGTISALVPLSFTPNAVAISPDGLRMAVGGDDETLMINLPTFISQRIPREAIALNFLQNGNLVVQQWNSVSVVAPELNLKCKFDMGTMAVSPDGTLFAVSVRNKLFLVDQACSILGSVKIGATPRTMGFYEGRIYAVMYDNSIAVIGVTPTRWGIPSRENK